MRASDLLKHITVKNRTIPAGRYLSHLRFLPVYLEPTAQADFHGQAMYRQAYMNNNRAAEDAWEQAAIAMGEHQASLPPPGGITADSKPGEESEAHEQRDGTPVTLDRS